MRTTTTELTCDNCGHAYAADALKPYSDEPQELSPAGDDWPDCPRCAHRYGQPVADWRAGWNFEDADRIADAARAKGMNAEALTDNEAMAIHEELEAATAGSSLFSQIAGMTRDYCAAMGYTKAEGGA